MNRRTVPFLLLLLLSTHGVIAKPPSDARLADVITSVVRVSCGSATATGFAWTGSDESKARIVTALHAVSQCNQPTVHYGGATIEEKKATVVATSAAHDLAILEVKGVKLTPLKPNKAVPPNWERYVIVGHPVGSIAATAHEIVKQYGTKSVRGHLSVPKLMQIAAEEEKNKKETDESKKKPPGLDLEMMVYSFSGGPMVPGHSGAPIVDHNGDVIAIAIGGLEHGTLEINWAVPVAGLDSVVGNASARINNADILFSAEVLDADVMGGGALTCGSLNLTKLRTRNFSDLIASSDDPAGFQYLAAKLTFGGAALDPGPLSFDVYRDLDIGAVVVVPTGSRLIATSKGCQADVGNDGVRMWVAAAATPDFPKANATFIAFEASQIRKRNGWIDGEFTYASPRFGADGSMLLRKGVLISGRGPEDYLFETLAYRPGHALIVAVTKDQMDRDLWCGGFRSDSLPPACIAARARHREFTSAALATHLSGWAWGFDVDPT